MVLIITGNYAGCTLDQPSNFDLNNIFTPVNAQALDQLLRETGYPDKDRRFLVNGFNLGFDLGYRGPEDVHITSPNLKFVIGDERILWSKVMDEVKAKRFAGPFENIPFKQYIQSPIGLVPKDGGRKTRLIFHLSYPKNGETSVNFHTPEHLCSVKYKDFDDAVQLCINQDKNCKAGKSDFSAAFRHLPIDPFFWKFLLMKAKNPSNSKWYYFVDKCLPFGSSRSCALFQKFSNAIAHIMRIKTKFDNVNYLDDFFFVAFCMALCNGQINEFIAVCRRINFPISLDKTFWGSTRIVFLGLLIDTVTQRVCIPLDKLQTAKNLINTAIIKRKLTLEQLQQITGFLNFLGKAVVPGRAFTRRLYAHQTLVNRKHHHIPVNREMKLDLKCWLAFLEMDEVCSRPFFHFQESTPVDMSTDASRNAYLGAGGTFNGQWFILQWDELFMLENEPSINYLELYAVTIGILLWIQHFQNCAIQIKCDNMSVVHMINNNSSKCRNCMVLIRLIVLHSLKVNVKVTVTYIPSKRNKYPDHLSRLRYRQFRRESKAEGIKFNNTPRQIPEELWPMSKLWLSDKT